MSRTTKYAATTALTAAFVTTSALNVQAATLAEAVNMAIANHPDVAIAAAAVALWLSFSSRVSILNASMAISCVADAIAINKHNAAAIAKCSVILSPAKKSTPNKIKPWQKSIQLRRCPNQSYNRGSLIRSTKGDHKKLML